MTRKLGLFQNKSCFYQGFLCCLEESEELGYVLLMQLHLVCSYFVKDVVVSWHSLVEGFELVVMLGYWHVSMSQLKAIG